MAPPSFQTKPALLKLFARKKSGFIDPSRPLNLLGEPDSPLLSLLLSDLLSHASYAHQLPEGARLVQDTPSNRLPMIAVDFVPFGLSCQALAVRVYRAWLKAATPTVELPTSLHADFLKVKILGLMCYYL